MKVKHTDADTAVGGPSGEADDSDPRVSSPAATGGAGTVFEHHVGAYWLAQLLVSGIPPILISTTVNEVSFQTEHLGWNTDDFLIVCQRTGATLQKLIGQVKRSFTVSAADEECIKAITDFWKDFKGAQFTPGDRLVLLTLRGTNTLLTDFGGLLENARAARDGAEFEKRLSTSGLVSKTAVGHCRALQKIIGDIEGRDVSTVDIWPFLRVLHVLSLDLVSPTAQTEAQMRSVLAHTVQAGDRVAGAEATWNALVVEAGTAIPAARTLRRADLPAALLERHAPVGTTEHRMLQALKEHSNFVLAARSTIGQDFHLERPALVRRALDALEKAQVIIIAGSAGTGKSVVAQDAMKALAPDHFVFAFRVEEFAEAHLTRTFGAIDPSANAATVKAVLAAQGSKTMLVESVERLLEHSKRDAFSDLMTLAREDGALRIILTCRDYSVEQVRASFLQPAGIAHSVINVPPLDDGELGRVEAAHPALGIPLRTAALREILRNPFFLDKSLQIAWAPDKPVPQSERELRDLFWREIVRADHRVAAGMGRLREAALQEIAVRRGRALSPHIASNDIDPAVIDSLRRDSLISSPEGTPALVATAHDVLEDWAILQWLDEQHLTDAGSFQALSAAIGAHPAVRRSYRKWVAELIELDSAAADGLFQAAVTETGISVQFRDDTLISLLKAPAAPAFLVRHEALLMANDRALLRRVIHLLRVACVKAPDWLAGLGGAAGSILNVPDGSAWEAVLRLVHRNLGSFTPQERGLLLGLIEDAVRGVSWWVPDIEAADSVAAIGHWLLDDLRDYGGEQARKRVLEVIAKIPRADPVRFADALRGQVEEGRRRDPVAEDLRDLIFAGISGMPAARDLPDLIVEVGGDYLLATEEDITTEHRYERSPMNVDLHFGIHESLSHSSYPASAIRGPWSQLLRHHSTKGLDFYIKVFSHVADWYAHPRLHSRVESPWEVELTFADGTTRKQWASARLWGLYRGMSTSLHPLESMLMALENWLLEVGKQSPHLLDAILVDLLRRSDSAALAAVVASVAIAYPHASGEALLVLLSARDYVVMDRSRLPNEPQLSNMAGMFPTFRADHQVYEMERKQSNGLPHRNHDLEYAVANLQLGPLATRVQALLDRHLAALPPKEEQDKSDLMWRLAIHRMDFRQYEVSKTPAPEIPPAVEKEGGAPQTYVRLDPKPPDADVQAMVDEGAEARAAMSARLGVFLWGLQAFQRESGKYHPSLWAAEIVEAQAIDGEKDHGDGSRSGPGFVAAVCVRDHWGEMSEEQRSWCIEAVCSEVLREADSKDFMAHLQRNSMSADRACATVLAPLIRNPLAEDKLRRVQEAFAAAFTHHVEEVRWCATVSIDEKTWLADRSLALRCLSAIATEAATIDAARAVEEDRDYNKRRQMPDIVAAASADIRARFWTDGAFADDAHATLDISDGYGSDSVKRMLVLLGRIPQDPLAIAGFARATETLVGWWKSGDDRHEKRSRDFHAEAEISKRLQEFLLRTTREAAKTVLAPVLAAVDRHPNELQTIMQGLTGIQDSNPHTEQYWFLWSLFAEAVKTAKWVKGLGSEHPTGSSLLSAIFLTAHWKDEVRHWRFLAGYEQLVHGLFEALPPTDIVLDDYTRFLYHIGEHSLPGAFVRIADALRRGDQQKMLGKSNTPFMLEAILRRYVYGRPLELKRDARLRDAVLFILDCLVENGSSAAFRMRDDFVTPAA